MSSTRRLVALGFAALVLLSAAGSATAATAQHDGQATHDGAVDPPALVVDLSDDGSATVTVSFTYNLSDADRQQAFEELRDTESARTEFRDRFQSRMASVASAAENETGREMSVDDATLEFSTEGSTGVVEASVTWNGLAAVDGDQLTVTEPFASGFEGERSVHVLAPDGYGIDAASPAPDTRSDGHLTWNGGTDLTGFEVVATAPEDTDDSDDTDDVDDSDTGDGETTEAANGGDGTGTDEESDGDSGPGFGVLAAVGALLSIAGLARWRE